MPSNHPLNEILESNSYLGRVDEELQTGLSESFVYVLSSSSGKSVLKLQIDRREYDFYLKFAPEKLPGVNWLPQILANGTYHEWNWLQLEFIPNPWPRSKWNVDSRSLAILKTLHETIVSPDEFKWTEVSWRPSDLVFCKDVLPASTVDLLFSFQDCFTEISGTDAALCSGDPYPLNWLERPGGELVKIDWQGLALEHRGFDLAGWMSTLIPVRDIEHIARLYLSLGGEAVEEEHVASLTRATIIFYARRCNLVFKHAAESSDPDRWQAGTETMIKQLPSWLTTVEHVL